MAKDQAGRWFVATWVALWTGALSLAGAIAAQSEPVSQPSPVKAALEKIVADFHRALQDADERYQKQVQPIAQRRSQANGRASTFGPDLYR